METKKGLDNRTEATPMQIDPNYTAGMSWDRAFGFRVTKNFNNKVWFGMALENSQILADGLGRFRQLLNRRTGNRRRTV